jgi:ribonucleotide reductase alpha subunit
MVEDNKDLEVLLEATEGLGFEDFFNIMVAVKKVTESYTKLNPDAKDESYGEMWLKIAKLTNRPEQDEQKVIEAYQKLFINPPELTFEAVKALTKINGKQ